MVERRGYRRPKSGWRTMDIYDGQEDAEYPCFDADVEIGEVAGKYKCPDCEGDGYLGCQFGTEYREEVCNYCKRSGYLLVGL